MLHTIRHYSISGNLTHYQLLDVPITASLKEIKLQFKKLTKQYHPDLNQHLTTEERETNKTKFVKMLDAYTILKDVRKRKEYDLSLKSQGTYTGGGGGGGSGVTGRYRQSEWHSRYYGEAKYYSRSGNGYTTTSGYNTRRHRVRFDHDHKPEESDSSGFHGKHRNYGDRYDVAHFDYDEHLNRNLKFEQRLIDKKLDSAVKERILAQLAKSGRVITEEVKTKHLLRQAQLHTSRNKPTTEYMTYPSSNPYYNYSRQSENDTSTARTFMYMGGGGFSLYILYKLVT